MKTQFVLCDTSKYYDQDDARLLAEFGVKNYVHSRTWERIARRRAEVIAKMQADTEVDKLWLRQLTEALESRNAEYDRLYRWAESTLGKKKMRKHMTREAVAHSLRTAWAAGVRDAGHTCQYVIDDNSAWHPCAVCGIAKPDDDSGRVYPQAWRATGRGRGIYRDNNGVMEYWEDSIYPAKGNRIWVVCESAWRTLEDIDQSQYGPLEKVPSPDCSNCDGSGCLDCVTRTQHDNWCVHNCPTCCGG